MNIALAGFTPLEVLGWERLGEKHGFKVLQPVIGCSEMLQEDWQFFASRPHVLVVHAGRSDFFSDVHIEANRQVFRSVPTLVLAPVEPAFIFKIHRYDIAGLLAPETSEEELAECVAKLHRGDKYFSPAIVDALVAFSYEHSTAGGRTASSAAHLKITQPLSIRELEILRLVVKGLSAKEIADKLFLSVHTIYTHRKNILRKLACKNAAELVSYALDKGLLRAVQET
ncbi:MAG: response regulator transcription factor [Flavobacteriales bacterium]|nr:response regulator transcription factor [Flavobacteriales bacterium]